MSDAGYNYHNLESNEEIFNSPFIRKMRQLYTGGTLSTMYGATYEDHLRDNNISLDNGARLSDSLHEQQKREDEYYAEHAKTLSEHAVKEKRMWDGINDMGEERGNMLKTAAEIQAKSEASLIESSPYMVDVQIPADLKEAANLHKIVVNKKNGSIWVKSAAVGQGKSFYMKLTKSAAQNSHNLFVKAMTKKYPELVASNLSEYLRHAAFVPIEQASQ